MKAIAKISADDRKVLFTRTALNLNIHPAIVEKDFWVCFMLDHLFHDCQYRTFWEKITILHKMANFPEEKILPRRYARHLYDVYRMADSNIKDSAFKRKELLEKDINFKQKFYYARSAHYETATLAEIELIPAEWIMADLKKDYDAMREMIYGSYPSFDDIIDRLKKLQDEIHKLV